MYSTWGFYRLTTTQIHIVCYIFFGSHLFIKVMLRFAEIIIQSEIFESTEIINSKSVISI